MSEFNQDLSRELKPQELDEIKGQIAALLNYSSPSGVPAKIENDIINKLTEDDRKIILDRIVGLLELPTGPMKELFPNEVDEVKGQIAALLNYSSPSGVPAKIEKGTLDKLTIENRQTILEKVKQLLEM